MRNQNVRQVVSQRTFWFLISRSHSKISYRNLVMISLFGVNVDVE